MVNIGIGLSKSPFLWVSGKISGHIFVNQLLQVNIRPAQGPDHHVSAGTSIGAHITTWVAYNLITGIISSAVQDFVPCSYYRPIGTSPLLNWNGLHR